MSNPHLKIVQYPNPECRAYHVNVLVSGNMRCWSFGRNDILGNYGEKKPDKLVKEFAEALGAIPGVESGTLESYEISITKAEAFEWSDISPFVVGLIVKRLFPDQVGGTLEVTTTLNYMAGNYGRHFDLAKRFGVQVDVDINDAHPSLDLEFLLDPQSPHFAAKPVVDPEAVADAEERLDTVDEVPHAAQGGEPSAELDAGGTQQEGAL